MHVEDIIDRHPVHHLANGQLLSRHSSTRAFKLRVNGVNADGSLQVGDWQETKTLTHPDAESQAVSARSPQLTESGDGPEPVLLAGEGVEPLRV